MSAVKNSEESYKRELDQVCRIISALQNASRLRLSMIGFIQLKQELVETTSQSVKNSRRVLKNQEEKNHKELENVLDCQPSLRGRSNTSKTCLSAM